jgi:hypothetical protein
MLECLLRQVVDGEQNLNQDSNTPMTRAEHPLRVPLAALYGMTTLLSAGAALAAVVLLLGACAVLRGIEVVAAERR